MKIIFLLLLVVACGKNEISPINSNAGRVRIDPLIQPFYDSFILKASAFNAEPEYSSIDIFFDWEGIESSAYCETYSNGHAKIVVDGPTWVAINDVNRERLFYHEMAHCYLGRDHVLPENTDALDLMIPTIQESNFAGYVADYDFRIRQLFEFAPTSETFVYQPY